MTIPRARWVLPDSDGPSPFAYKGRIIDHTGGFEVTPPELVARHNSLAAEVELLTEQNRLLKERLGQSD